MELAPWEFSKDIKDPRVRMKHNMEFFQILGIPIFKWKKRAFDWQGWVDKIKNKITSWGTRWLNPARKLVLINFILSAYLIYAYLISLAPKRVMKDVTREIRRFLWKGGKSSNLKKFTW